MHKIQEKFGCIIPLLTACTHALKVDKPMPLDAIRYVMSNVIRQ